MTPLEQLKAARELISVPERWTQRFYSRDENYIPVPVHAPEAVRFCMDGALKKVVSGVSTVDARRALVTVCQGNFAAFNDSHSHAEVLAVFDKAIASLEAQQ